jgi:hypothetical protein
MSPLDSFWRGLFILLWISRYFLKIILKEEIRNLKPLPARSPALRGEGRDFDIRISDLILEGGFYEKAFGWNSNGKRE